MSTVTLGDLFVSDEPGFACSKNKLVSDGLVHLRPFNISQSGQLELAETYRIPLLEAPEGKSTLFAGDILFNNTNSAELVGKSAVVSEPMTAGFSNHLTRIRVDKNRVEPRWLGYWLRHLRTTGFFTANATQWVSQAAFRTSDLRKIQIDLPDLSEQRRSVDLLSRAEGIVNLRHEAEQKAAEVIPALFFQMFGAPGGSSRQWPRTSLNAVCEISYGLADKLNSSISADAGIRILTISNIRLDGSIDHSVKRYCVPTAATHRKAEVRCGDLLFNWRNGSEHHIGKTALWESNEAVLHVSFLLRLRPNTSKILPSFLWAQLNALRASGFFITSARQQINRKFNASELGALEVAVPPVHLQKRFSHFVDQLRGLTKLQRAASLKAEATFHALSARSFARGAWQRCSGVGELHDVAAERFTACVASGAQLSAKRGQCY